MNSRASLVWRAFRTEQPVGHDYRGYALAPLQGVSPSLLIVLVIHGPPNISYTRYLVEETRCMTNRAEQASLCVFLRYPCSLDRPEGGCFLIPLLLLTVRSVGGAVYRKGDTHDKCFLPCVVSTGSFHEGSYRGLLALLLNSSPLRSTRQCYFVTCTFGYFSVYILV